MNSKIFIPLRDLISEKIARDLLLFTFLFFLVLAQEWDNILLFLFPLSSFAFSFFFNIINSNKWRTEFIDRMLLYHPLGSEQKNANRFLFCALLELILLFWYGAESLYHPQLVDNYFLYFLFLMVFFYTFGFYWIFIDLWKYSKIGVIFYGINPADSRLTDKGVGEKLEKLISTLKIDTYKKISIISFLVFLFVNLLNLFLHLMITLSIDIGVLTFTLNLPGTGIEDSNPITLSYIIYLSLILSPVLTIIFLKLTYKNINQINNKKLNEILNSIPNTYRILILENLKALNRKLKEELRRE
ncbi:MAG: hypothetical protein ACTSR8_22350 [Promethearchaeota archaeon]